MATRKMRQPFWAALPPPGDTQNETDFGMELRKSGQRGHAKRDRIPRKMRQAES